MKTFITSILIIGFCSVTLAADYKYNELGKVETELSDLSNKNEYLYDDRGQLLQIRREGLQQTTNLPIAQLTLPNVQTLIVGDTYTLNANNSTNPSAPGSTLLYRWDLDGDGTWDTNFSTQSQINHIYEQAGDYPIRLQVKNAAGASHTTSSILRVFSIDKGSTPVAVITSSIGNATSGDIAQVGAGIFLSANSSSDPDGDLESYLWDFGDGSSTRTFSTQTKSYAAPGDYTVSLTVTDSRGQTNTAQKTITVQPADAQVAPTISTPSTSENITQGQLLSIPVTYTDDGSFNQLRFSTSGATGAYISQVTNQPGVMRFYWAPDANQQGAFNVSLTVTDGDNLAATHNISVNVAQDSTPGVTQRFVREIRTLGLDGVDAKHVEAYGNVLYVAGDDAYKGLFTVNITSPSTVTTFNTINTNQGSLETRKTNDIAVTNYGVFAARYNLSEVRGFSLGLNPILESEALDSYNSNDFKSARFQNIVADNNIILALDDRYGNLWRITESSNRLAGTHSANNGFYTGYKPAIHKSKNYVYVISSSGVSIIDYSSGLQFKGLVPSSSNVRSIFIPDGSNYLYMGYGYGNDGLVRVMDISNPAAPVEIASINLPTSNIAKIAGDNNGNVFAYSNNVIYYLRHVGNNITLATNSDYTNTTYSMFAKDGYLYLATRSGLGIYEYGEKANKRPTAINQQLTTRWDQPITVTFSGSDGDDDELSYEYVIDSVNQGQVTDRYYPTVKYVPPTGFEGINVFQFTANDGIQASLPGSVTVTVTAPPRAPTIDTISNKTVQETKLLSFNVTATDLDFQDEVTITATNLPTGATFDGNTFSWLPDYGTHSSSPYIVTFTAKDTTNRTATTQASISVTRQNRLPVISQFTASTVSGTAPLTTTLDVTASDPDTDGSIASISFDYGDGTQGTSTSHNYTSAGTYKAVVTVTDNLGGQATTSVDIQVNAFKPGVFSLNQTSVSVNEANGFVELIVLRKNGTDGVIDVNYQVNEGTAYPDTDYLVPSGVLTFASGETQLPIRIALIDDEQFEPEETFSLKLISASAGTLGTPTSGTIQLQDNDTVKLGTGQFRQASYNFIEQEGTVEITLERQGGTDGVLTLDYNVTGSTAAAGEDFVAATGQVRFMNGESFKTLTVQLKADDQHENSETMLLTLSGAAVGERDNATLTILDDDEAKPGTVYFVAGDTLELQEGTGLQEIEIQRTGGNDGEVSVRVLSHDGTAIAGEDYSTLSELLTFADGETSKFISLLVLDDSSFEEAKQLLLKLSSPSGGLAISQHELVITLTDNDPDNCPDIDNPNQNDFDQDGKGDACDDDDDNDGMLDEWESAQGLDTLNADDAELDLDNDGLNNLQESQYNTDPHKADTDGDSVNDKDEIEASTDPLKYDTQKPDATGAFPIILDLLMNHAY